jgi:hypothetical protein
VKQHKILFPVLIVFALILSSCENDLDNFFTIKNLSAGKITINFRANYYEVPSSNSNYVIRDIPKGSYSYSTTYEVPAGTESSSSEGPSSGTLDFKQNTKVLLVFSSTFVDSTYKLFATLSSNEDLSEDNPTAP